MASQELLNCISNNVESNDNSNIENLNKAYELLCLKGSDMTINSAKNYIIYNREQFLQNQDKINSFLVDNKFLDINWEIILEDSSNFTADISLVKILIKFTYFNMSELKKKELRLVLDEKSFEEFYDECKKIQKNL